MLRKFAILCCLLTPVAVNAAGRYQAVPLYNPSDGSGKVLILDTHNGQLWQWVEVGASTAGAAGRFLIYQGQLRPGKKMGEIVDQQ